MNRNETRKLQHISNNVLELVSDYKTIGNPAYIHFKKLHEELNGLADPGKVELNTGSALSVSAIVEKLKAIAANYGNPPFSLQVEIDKDGGIEFLVKVKTLFEIERNDRDKYIWPKHRDSVQSLIDDTTAFFESHYAEYLERCANAPEVVIENETQPA